VIYFTIGKQRERPRRRGQEQRWLAFSTLSFLSEISYQRELSLGKSSKR